MFTYPSIHGHTHPHTIMQAHTHRNVIILEDTIVGDPNRGRPEGSLFISYYIEVSRRALHLSLYNVYVFKLTHCQTSIHTHIVRRAYTHTTSVNYHYYFTYIGHTIKIDSLTTSQWTMKFREKYLPNQPLHLVFQKCWNWQISENCNQSKSSLIQNERASKWRIIFSTIGHINIQFIHKGKETTASFFRAVKSFNLIDPNGKYSLS